MMCVLMYIYSYIYILSLLKKPLIWTEDKNKLLTGAEEPIPRGLLQQTAFKM